MTNPKEKQREYNKRYNERNPDKRAFHCLKYRAKMRGKQFTITFDDFKNVWFKGGSIDREKNELGYVPGNIQCLPTIADNARKYWQTDYPMRNKYAEKQYTKLKARRTKQKPAPVVKTMASEATEFINAND